MYENNYPTSRDCGLAEWINSETSDSEQKSYEILTERADNNLKLQCIDPCGQPTASSDNFFRTCCPSVRPHFSKLAKHNEGNKVRYWRDYGSGRVNH